MRVLLIVEETDHAELYRRLSAEYSKDKGDADLAERKANQNKHRQRSLFESRDYRTSALRYHSGQYDRGGPLKPNSIIVECTSSVKVDLQL